MVNWLCVQKREAAQAPALRAEQGGPRPHLGHSEVGSRLVPGQSRTASRIFFPVFGIRDILVQIRILGSVSLTNGFGSGSVPKSSVTLDAKNLFFDIF